MSARDELRDCFLSDSRDRFEAAADAYRAEVLREVPAPAELTIFRAWRDADGIPLGLYTTEAAAREHCDTLLRRENTGRTWDWLTDEDGDLVQVFVTRLADRPEETTGYLVTPVTVAAEYDAEADE